MLNKLDKNFLVRAIRLYIPSQNAAGLPTLNAILGQNSVNVFEFTKQFNNLSKNYINEIVLNILINIYVDKKFEVILKKPTVAFLLYEQCLYLDKHLDDFDFSQDLLIIKLSELYKIAVFINKITNTELSLKCIFKSLLGTVKSMRQINIENDIQIICD